MLDIQQLRSHTTAVAERLAQRGYEFDTARFNVLEEQRKAVQVKTEELQASRNSISKQIGALKGQGKHEEAQAAMDQVAQIKTDLEQAADRFGCRSERIGRMVVEHSQPAARKRTRR